MGERAGIYGRVMDANGSPEANVAVMVTAGPSAAPDLAALTDTEGWFAFGDLADGRWTISAYAPDGRVGVGEASIGSHGMCVIFLSEQGVELSESLREFDDLDNLDPIPPSQSGLRQDTTRREPGWELSTPESD